MLLKTIVSAFVLGTLTSQAACSAAQPLQLSIKMDQQLYKIGSKVRINLVFTNTEDRTILILPSSQAYTANVFKFRRINDGKFGELIRFGENSIDFAELSKDVVRLGSKRSYTYSLEGQLTSQLPKFMGPNTAGLYLVFPGSAIRLPGFGAYSATARYVESTDSPINQLLHGENLLATDITSPPTQIQIAPR